MREIIEITGIGARMEGVGKLRDGRVAFVPFALPGERARVEYENTGGRFENASVVEILSASPDRTQTDCLYFGACGGCQTRHVSYQKALIYKTQIVRDALARIGGIENPVVMETIGLCAPLRARNKAEYPIAGKEIGVYKQKSRVILPVADCLLQRPESVRAMRAVRSALAQGALGDSLRFLVTRINQKGEMMLTLSGDAPKPPKMRFLIDECPEIKSLWYCNCNRQPKHALDGTCVHIAGEKVLYEELMGLSFSVSPQSFFQINVSQAETLYALALSAAGVSAGCTQRVLDAYCGAGTITLAAAKACREAVGVEIVPAAVADARKNAERNGLAEKARFILGDAPREIGRLLKSGERFDAFILDPPRRGAEKSLLDAVACARPERIAYVSCDPGALARDVRILSEKGYRLLWAQPVDMFAYTGHVETVVLMTRTGAEKG